MRIIIQRVKEASVSVAEEIVSEINQGLLILAGIEHEDTVADINWLVNKVAMLRIFDDENGVMNKSIQEIGGQLLVVSQFTLHASTRKGNRPSYLKAAKPEISIPLYNTFCKQLEQITAQEVKTGEFGATMQVHLINDGPVTIWIDSKNRE